MDDTRIGMAEVALRLPGVRSLKEKRGVLRPLVERLRQRFPVALAEVADQDQHQRARLGLAAVSGDPAVVRHLVQQVREWLDQQVGIEVLRFEDDYA